jgi:hypothetical protein
MLVGAPLFAAYNLRGSPVGASNERLIGAEKVFTRLLKTGLGDPASLSELDNVTAAFIALNHLINFVCMHSKSKFVPVASV